MDLKERPNGEAEEHVAALLEEVRRDLAPRMARWRRHRRVSRAAVVAVVLVLLAVQWFALFMVAGVVGLACAAMGTATAGLSVAILLLWNER